MSGKKVYRPRNWGKYNKSLIKRGSLTLWIDEAVLSGWYEAQKSGQKGASHKYSDIAIQCALQLRFHYKLTLRATQGFLMSLLRLMHPSLEVPCYTTLCRRLKALDLQQVCTSSEYGPRHLILDSTGLKMHGDGEWCARTHGPSKRRTWRKLHLGIDAETQEIVCAVVTTNEYKDSELFPECMEQLDPADIETVRGDGGYDDQKIYEACDQHAILPLIPPPKNAKIRQRRNLSDEPHPRDQALRYIRKHGRKAWRLNSGYSKRSLVETAMYRYKQCFSDKMSSRNLAAQKQEAFVKCNMMNRLTKLGLPHSALS